MCFLLSFLFKLMRGWFFLIAGGGKLLFDEGEFILLRRDNFLLRVQGGFLKLRGRVFFFDGGFLNWKGKILDSGWNSSFHWGRKLFFRWSACAIAFVECGCLKLLEDFLKLRGNHFLLKGDSFIWERKYFLWSFLWIEGGWGGNCLLLRNGFC